MLALFPIQQPLRNFYRRQHNKHIHQITVIYTNKKSALTYLLILQDEQKHREADYL